MMSSGRVIFRFFIFNPFFGFSPHSFGRILVYIVRALPTSASTFFNGFLLLDYLHIFHFVCGALRQIVYLLFVGRRYVLDCFVGFFEMQVKKMQFQEILYDIKKKYGLIIQGGIVNFEVLRPDGTVMSYKTVEKEAAKAGLHIRTGCECNPGACYDYLGIQDKEVQQLAGKKEGCSDNVEWILVERSVNEAPDLKGPNGGFRDIPDEAIGLDTVSVVDKQKYLQNQQLSRKEIPGKVEVVQLPLGSIRASLGYLSTFDDVYDFVRFVKEKYQARWQ
eukprot:TRINITY_DN12238_c0_g2_i1.p1 TRINITY_DN12238_c0_g2~~TRINITY_DN12238_c0_g2_i1.p1  ORF type:complete len:299 (-),score=24.38 TRINITY_DN12238_c0_g2_i1:1415-2242(-)